MIRAVGLAAADPGLATTFAAGCERLGLRTHAAPEGVVVAWEAPVGFAAEPDGSFLLLDGEHFPVDPTDPLGSPDEQAARLLAHVRRRGGIVDAHVEGLVTWWDGRTVRVLRDQGGVGTGLVTRLGGATVWSSEPAALLAAGLRPEVDPVAIDELLTIGWVAPPRWYLRGVDLIPAGHLAEVAPGRPHRLEAHHRHQSTPPLTGTPEEQSAELGRAVTAAVARRAKGRLAASLSAGVDSALVVAVLRRTLELPVETFTFHYHGYDGMLNEDEFAAETAALLGAPHHVLHVHPTDLAERFADMVAAFQSPISFGVHSFLQDDVRALGVDAVLGGSDPGFWHDHGRPGVVAAGLRRLPPSTLPALAALGRRTHGLPKAGILSSATLLAGHGVMNEYLRPDQRRALFGGLPAAGPLAADLVRATEVHRSTPATRRTGFVFEQFAVPEYVGLWNLRWGRAFGYPVRAPLWDVDVMAVAERRPDWSGDKPLLRRFAETLLPEGRAHAPKIYQEVPLAQWLRGPLQDFARDALAPERVRRASLFDPGAITALLDEHVRGDADHRWPLWTAMTAVEWALGLGAPVEDPLVKPA